MATPGYRQLVVEVPEDDHRRFKATLARLGLKISDILRPLAMKEMERLEKLEARRAAEMASD